MKIRHRQKYRFNSITSLIIFVLLGVVVTTVAHADGPAAAAYAATRNGNSWLLPGGVRASYEGGLYHLQMDHKTGHAASWASRMGLILSVGYVEESGYPVFPTIRVGANSGLPQTENQLTHGPLLLMSVGHRWQ